MTIRLSCSFLLLSVIGYTMAQLPPTQEFRGVWIATVKNIDWPKNGSQRVASQKQMFRGLLDYYEELNFNSVIVQVRTAGDALYFTNLAPFSRFLSGEEGNRNGWKEDPLTFMIEETHKRGMDFHAWVNPYRATADGATVALSDDHVYYKHPEWIISYGTKHYMDPGLPEVRRYILEVVDEIVENYDIDGIHMDDYFYPYTIWGEQFDDTNSYKKYGHAFDDQESWRRANVDTLVFNLYTTIKGQKPWVKFGISPFGVWRNKADDSRGSNTQAGQTNYDNLYCDPLLWAKEKWIDYLAPQLYWSRSFKKASYDTLSRWWANEIKNIDLYMGIGAYKVNSDSSWLESDEIFEQLKINRSNEVIDGEIFFSASSLQPHPTLTQRLVQKHYSEKTLPHMVTSGPAAESSGLELENIKVNSRQLRGKVVDASKVKAVLVCKEERGKLKPLKILRTRKGKFKFKKPSLWSGENELKFFTLDPYNRYGQQIITMVKRQNRWIKQW